MSGKEQETAQFSGTAAISHESESPITGPTTIVISHYHWADTNKDNIISDDEILAVYERYGEITDIDLDIDLIEEIWLGSVVPWDAATATLKLSIDAQPMASPRQKRSKPLKSPSSPTARR